MTGLSCLGLDAAQKTMNWADVTGAMTFEALKGQSDAFDPEILRLKEGGAADGNVQLVGERLRGFVEGSEVIARAKNIRTQDALSLRSMPQIHGACRNQFNHAAQQIDTELNSANDNPLLLAAEDGTWRAVSQEVLFIPVIALPNVPRQTTRCLVIPSLLQAKMVDFCT